MSAARSSMFASVVLDVDSTLCGIEGIDFLAARRGAEVGREIAQVTERAMRGEVRLESVYGERLGLIRPTVGDLDALRDAYVRTLAPGARESIAAMRAAGVQLMLVSGGIWQAIQPVARSLGFADEELNAVALRFDTIGQYASFDAASPLTRQTGKAEIVGALIDGGRLPRPVLAVGDGSTDIPMRDVADAFAAFVGFARRESVVAKADLEIGTFAELAARVRGERVRG